jgi:SAM-dependent methyltransferase
VKRGIEIMNLVEDFVNFLTKYSWIYHFKVTNILSDNIVKEIPSEWLTFLKSLSIEQFNQIFFSNQSTESVPAEVTQFLASFNLLKVPLEKCPLSSSSLSNTQRRGISAKKEHEIVNFANFIEARCKTIGVKSIVDIGSGLGYLGEELTRRGFKVLGVEGSEGHSESAERRKKVNDSHNFHTVHLHIDNSQECLDNLNSLVDADSCLVGLHCCGDLTPQLLNIFIKSQRFSSLMLVSCCYHKMRQTKDRFDNFPLSAQLSISVKNCKRPSVFSGFMLRLGAQETKKRWLEMRLEEHKKHTNNVGFRAILEKVGNDNKIELKKKKRKGVLQRDFDSIDAFINSLSERYEIGDKVHNFSEQIFECFQENSQHFDLFEILTGLQFLLQSVIENLVHLDRLLYLQEKGNFGETGLFEIFDDLLSPRNIVIHAKK